MSSPSNGSHLRVERIQDAVVVRLIGCDQINDQNAPMLKGEFTALMDEVGASPVTLDLRDVSFITSDGLGVLISANSKVRAAGGHLTICGVNPTIMEVIEVTQLTRLLDVRAGNPPHTGKSG